MPTHAQWKGLQAWEPAKGTPRCPLRPGHHVTAPVTSGEVREFVIPIHRAERSSKSCVFRPGGSKSKRSHWGWLKQSQPRVLMVPQTLPLPDGVFKMCVRDARLLLLGPEARRVSGDNQARERTWEIHRPLTKAKVKTRIFLKMFRVRCDGSVGVGG